MRRSLVQSALCGLSRSKSETAIPKELGMDMFQYCIQGGEEYVKRLKALKSALVAAWAVLVDVNDREMCFRRQQLAADVHVLEKYGPSYSLNSVRNKRSVKTSTGFSVSYQCVPQNDIFVT